MKKTLPLGHIPEKCMRTACNNKPTNKISISFAVHNNHEPAVSSPILWLCDEHATDIDFKSAGVDANWSQICSWFKNSGLQEPKKEFTKLLIEPINESNNNSTISK